MTSTLPSTDQGASVTLPPDFTWGVATASYQIEGAVAEDGRTPSIWDTFCRVPGAVAHGDTGDVACDHYHRMEEDVATMAALGVGSYRFSVAWPRVRPDAGPVNPAGLDFYDSLVDTLLRHDIAPWLTLYHWDLPQTLEDAGGWTVRATADRFVEYAVAVHERLGDRVPVWTTLNEPWCSAFLGYTNGRHAPGRREGAAGLRAAHHLLLAHGRATTELRARGAETLGITLNLTVADPADPADAADVDAARRIDSLHNRLFLDPITRAAYPEDLLADTEHLGWTDVVHDGDLEAIAAPIDVLGVNYYRGDQVSGHPDAEPDEGQPSPFVGSEHVSFPSRGLPRTAMDWEVQPEGLTRLLVRLHDDHPGLPLVVTENGAAYDDSQAPDGSVDDPERVAYLDSHVRAVAAARDAGADVRGYFAWSFLDNFEWAEGYAKRFGLVHVDYPTQRRTPKASAHWYAELCRTGRLPRPPEPVA
ncbi:GH1 family beta-glucosidase [Nocardioides euryhalodurans]|uniref:Beta-glucosidase n=1 Tax=Nocardioides euryhalodurans TaxID=2518370 RepID=A0A4P7GN62_9ACTN|nr:GH1 family beta-glucosidase [Nocardioides euryhalodurans]QBR93237.1 beta-glucosidase [Nocardioides euryhalodurans]